MAPETARQAVEQTPVEPPGPAITARRGLHLVSWNVNGLRAVSRKGGLEWLRRCGATAICLQEVRCTAAQAGNDLLPGYRAHWDTGERLGYAGVATFTRKKPVSVRRGLGHPELDAEGRLLTVELEDLYLVNVYTPNVRRTLERLPLRTEVWDPAFLAYCRQLEQHKPVVFCGDLNVSHQEIDLANARANRGNAGFTDQERAGFGRLLAAGFVDVFRHFEPGPGHYTWWSNQPGVRQRNIGWRIDYFLASAGLLARIQAAQIHPDVLGSDHCPVSLTLDGPPPRRRAMRPSPAASPPAASTRAARQRRPDKDAPATAGGAARRRQPTAPDRSD